MSPVYIRDVKQGSDEWVRLRLGIPTASAFGRILTPAKLAPSAQAAVYIDELCAEWALGERDDFGGTEWVDRGTVLEPMARAWYAFDTDAEVEEVGFCYRDDARMVGCSPDGLVGAAGLLELKAPMPKTHLGYLRQGVVPTAYVLQVQGQLWVTGRAWCDFCSFCPNLPGFRIRAEPEDRYQAAFDEHLPAFIEEMLEAREHLRSLGVVPVHEPQPEYEYLF